MSIDFLLFHWLYVCLTWKELLSVRKSWECDLLQFRGNLVNKNRINKKHGPLRKSFLRQHYFIFPLYFVWHSIPIPELNNLTYILTSKNTDVFSTVYNNSSFEKSRDLTSDILRMYSQTKYCLKPRSYVP